MHIVLVRHGDAVGASAVGGVDADRFLSDVGRAQAQRLGAWLAEQVDLHPDEVWVSPWTRTVQTCELVLGAWGVPVAPESRRFLAAQDHTAVADALLGAGPDASVVLVGHNPQMSVLTSLLTGRRDLPGHSPGTVVILRGDPEPGGCVLVDRRPGG